MAQKPGAGDAIKLAQSCSDKFGDLTPALSQVSQEIDRQISDSFGAQRSPDGTPWAPTKDGKPFDASGDMRRAITVLVSGKGTVTITGPSYLKAHMKGGTRNGKPNSPPKRNPLPLVSDGEDWALTPQLTVETQNQIIKHVLGGQ